MGARRARSVVLDAGALIAFERNDRKVRTLIELAASSGATLYAPAGVVAQVWRDGRKQARMQGEVVDDCDLYMRKYSPDGGLIWAKSYGASDGFQGAFGMALGSSGTIALSGTFVGSLDLGGGGL